MKISSKAYSVIPLMVYVFPLLVCPYAKMLADQIGNQRPNRPGQSCQYRSFMDVQAYERGKTKGKKNNSQLMPVRTERATSLAASSYTCLVWMSVLNTLSTERKKK